MAMAWKIKESSHILTLVVNRGKDIPRLRSKIKLLATTLGFRRLAIVQLAVAASEGGRLLLNMFGGGKVRISIVAFAGAGSSSGLELVFAGKRGCFKTIKNQTFCSSDFNINEVKPIPGLKKVLDAIIIKGGDHGQPLHLYGLKKCRLTWEELQKKSSGIRNQLFADTEESYLENLRAKHAEVVKLLQEKSERNLELDRINNDLFKLNQELESLANERTIAEMALKIADQVRNPASVIGGLARLLSRKLPELGERESKKLNAIIEQAQNLEAIVKNFEELADRENRYFVEENLGEIIREAINSCNAIKQKGIKIDLQLPAESLTVKANRSIIKIALLHILRNSCEAADRGSKIVVELTRKEGKPIIRVADRGRQIPDKIMKKLFESQHLKKKYAKGLSLVIVKQIMAEHQGEIGIKNRKGGGVEVTLTFPVRWQESM
jgi:signal transduction histidine kinase